MILRHPVDVFSSYRKRKERQPEASWLDITIDDFIEEYNQYLNQIRSLMNNDQCLILRYEDFVNKPEEEFSQICHFLNEPFERKPIAEDEPRLRDKNIDPILTRKITPKTKEWSDYMSSDEVRVIESELSYGLKQFGYKPKL